MVPSEAVLGRRNARRNPARPEVTRRGPARCLRTACVPCVSCSSRTPRNRWAVARC